MRPRARSWLALMALWLLLPHIGCSGLGFGLSESDATSDTLDVRLFLYPPDGSDVPIQITQPVAVESDTYGRIPLDVGVVISGTLQIESTSSQGTPTLAGLSAYVSATDLDTGLTYKTQTSTSSPDFSLKLPNGNYDFTFGPREDGLPFPPQRLSNLEISPRSAGDLGIPPLDAGYPVQVRLETPEGSPLLGAVVYTISEESGMRSSTPLSSMEGSHWLQVATGTQQIWLGPDSSQSTALYHHMLGTLSVREAQTEALVFRYSVPVQRLNGHIVDLLGQDVAGATLFLTRQTDTLEGSFQATFSADEQGSFSLSVPEGLYDLVIRPLNKSTGSSGLSGTRLSRLQVLADSPLSLGNITLQNTVLVTGSVAGSDGSLLAGASVTLSSSDRANYGASAITDENGTFSMQAGMGDFVMEIDPPDGAGLVRSVEAIYVASNATELGSIQLELGFEASFQFVVDDKALPGLWVEVRNVGAGSGTGTTATELLFDTVTDEEGKARLILPRSDSGLLMR